MISIHKAMKDSLKIFLTTSLFFSVSMISYLLLSDPIFHYKYSRQTQVLVLIGFGIIFGLMNMAAYWYNRRKYPGLAGLTYARQKRVRIFEGTLTEAIGICTESLIKLKVPKIQRKSKTIIEGCTPLTFYQVGERITLRFVELDKCRTEVHISCKPRYFGVVWDLGTGCYIVNAIEESFKEHQRPN
jgi:hypothetical protein